MSKCAICGSEGVLKVEKLETGLKDYSGIPIVIENLKVHHCTKASCGNTWMSQLESDRIDDEILKRQRVPLVASEINMIWQSLDLPTKTAAANYLNLNSKAFTKWTNGYSELNAAYDLLLRLAVFSRANFNFIQHLHDKNFRFEKEDYELICDKFGGSWKFQNIEVTVSKTGYLQQSEASRALNYLAVGKIDAQYLVPTPYFSDSGEEAA